MTKLQCVVRSSYIILGTAFLGLACQQQDPGFHGHPRDLMGDGSSNKTELGGYWWTLVDRSGKSEVMPYVGKLDPTDTVTRPVELTGALREGNGIEDGKYHVKGRVAPPPVAGDPMAIDRYWDAFYGPAGNQVPGFCGTNGCQAKMIPAAGIGFGFKSNNTPLGLDSEFRVGISFKAKLGPAHTTGKPVNLTIALDLTDVPDPTMADHFGSSHVDTFAPDQSEATNAPLCRFAGSTTDVTPYGTKRLSCFADLTTQGHSVLDVGTEMKTFCLNWDHFGPPTGYEAEYAELHPGSEGMTKALTAHAVKLVFQAHQPSSDETLDPVAFDFYVDDVFLLDETLWNEKCEQSGAIIPPVL